MGQIKKIMAYYYASFSEYLLSDIIKCHFFLIWPISEDMSEVLTKIWFIFLGDLKTSKYPSEINWPLEIQLLFPLLVVAYLYDHQVIDHAHAAEPPSEKGFVVQPLLWQYQIWSFKSEDEKSEYQQNKVSLQLCPD